MATWLSEVNTALYLTGQRQIADASTFNTDSSLDRIQAQAKYAYNELYMLLWREMRPRFLQREFSITTTASDNTYNVDSTTAPEYFIQDSWRCTTSGSARSHIEYVDYMALQQAYPDGFTTTGVPDYWFLYPPDGTGTDVIGFYPIPNATLTIKYLAHLKPVALSAAATTIKFPDEYKGVLITYCQMAIEIFLAEGKALDIAQFLEPMITSIKAISLGVLDDKPKLVNSMQIHGRNIRRSIYTNRNP